MSWGLVLLLDGYPPGHKNKCHPPAKSDDYSYFYLIFIAFYPLQEGLVSSFSANRIIEYYYGSI